MDFTLGDVIDFSFVLADVTFALAIEYLEDASCGLDGEGCVRDTRHCGASTEGSRKNHEDSQVDILRLKGELLDESGARIEHHANVNESNAQAVTEGSASNVSVAGALRRWLREQVVVLAQYKLLVIMTEADNGAVVVDDVDQETVAFRISVRQDGGLRFI